MQIILCRWKAWCTRLLPRTQICSCERALFAPIFFFYSWEKNQNQIWSDKNRVCGDSTASRFPNDKYLQPQLWSWRFQATSTYRSWSYDKTGRQSGCCKVDFVAAKLLPVFVFVLSFCSCTNGKAITIKCTLDAAHLCFHIRTCALQWQQCSAAAALEFSDRQSPAPKVSQCIGLTPAEGAGGGGGSPDEHVQNTCNAAVTWQLSRLLISVFISLKQSEKRKKRKKERA